MRAPKRNQEGEEDNEKQIEGEVFEEQNNSSQSSQSIDEIEEIDEEEEKSGGFFGPTIKATAAKQGIRIILAVIVLGFIVYKMFLAPNDDEEPPPPPAFSIKPKLPPAQEKIKLKGGPRSSIANPDKPLQANDTVVKQEVRLEKPELPPLDLQVDLEPELPKLVTPDPALALPAPGPTEAAPPPSSPIEMAQQSFSGTPGPSKEGAPDTDQASPEIINGVRIINNAELTLEQKRKAAMFAMGQGRGPTLKSNTRKQSDFFIPDNSIVAIRKTETKDANTQMVRNLNETLMQGKILYVILESAIDSQLPGPVRGIVAEHVYAESGDNILIHAGSRAFGTYSSQITRGQSRLMIRWNRILRSDGVVISLNAEAGDQFGRAGLRGNVDNRFGDTIGNALLLSLATLGTGILADRFSDGAGQSQTINPSSGTITMGNIRPINVAVQSAMQTITGIIQQLTQGGNLTPIITLHHGTRMAVMVMQDIKIPKFRKKTI